MAAHLPAFAVIGFKPNPRKMVKHIGAFGNKEFP